MLGGGGGEGRRTMAWLDRMVSSVGLKEREREIKRERDKERER